MSRRHDGLVQLGDLNGPATWKSTGTLLSIRFPTLSFNRTQWREVERLRYFAEPVFLLWDGTANSDNRIIGYEQDSISVTFHLSEDQTWSS